MSEQLELGPVARVTDPPMSHAAARKVRPANSDLVAAVRAAVRERGPMTAYDIGRAVEEEHGSRWAFDTIRTACKRAGLVKLSRTSLSPRGNGAHLYDLVI